jgi:hypothetical protein
LVYEVALDVHFGHELVPHECFGHCASVLGGNRQKNKIGHVSKLKLAMTERPKRLRGATP